MTDAERPVAMIERLAALEKAASPGPWWPALEHVGVSGIFRKDGAFVAEANTHEDTTFIVTARNHLSLLIAMARLAVEADRLAWGDARRIAALESRHAASGSAAPEDINEGNVWKVVQPKPAVGTQTAEERANRYIDRLRPHIDYGTLAAWKDEIVGALVTEICAAESAARAAGRRDGLEEALAKFERLSIEDDAAPWAAAVVKELLDRLDAPAAETGDGAP